MGNVALKWEKFVHAMIDNGGYRNVLEGLRNTLLVAVFGLIIGIAIGTIIAAVEVMPKYKRLPRALNKLCQLYVAFFRGTPLVVQLLVGYFVLRPLLGLNLSALASCIIIYGMNSGAYVSEIMRGGIQSVDGGQMEAGRALGNEFIALVKDTSIVSFVGTTDLYVAFKFIGTNNYEFMIPYLVMALIYIVMVLLITFGIHMMERSLKKSDRLN